MAKKDKPVEVIDLDAIPKKVVPIRGQVQCQSIVCGYRYKVPAYTPHGTIIECPSCGWRQYYHAK